MSADADPDADPDAVTTVEVSPRYDLATTTAPLRLGSGDRCARADGPSVLWRATRTPQGAATARYRHVPADAVVEVAAWGPGAAWLAGEAPTLLGMRDDVAGFAALVTDHPVLGRLHRAHPEVRIGRSAAVFEALVPTICGQKVTGLEAKRAWYGIVDRWGEIAPGPGALRLAPAPATLAAVPYEDFHRLGLERRRAEVVRAVARHATRLEETVAMGPVEAEARLRAIDGIGVWSAAEVRRIALGDADAVSYGDYHLPQLVSYTLLGQRRGSDELMAELLAPFAPHRGRVVRLLEIAGRFPPRRGPRMAPSSMRDR